MTCALGPYNFEFMDAGPSRDRHAVSGRRHLQQSLGAAGGDCCCEHCQTNFKAATGLTCRARPRISDPARRAFLEWRVARLTEFWKRWDASIRAHQPGGALHPERHRRDLKTGGELAPIQFADYQARRGITPAVGERPHARRNTGR